MHDFMISGGSPISAALFEDLFPCFLVVFVLVGSFDARSFPLRWQKLAGGLAILISKFQSGRNGAALMAQ